MNINALNNRLGDALGRPNGTDPRFAWKESTDCFYYARRHMGEEFQKRCLAGRIGRRWLLCQWRPPEILKDGQMVPISEDLWFQMFQGRKPYPAKGSYSAHVETALPFGALPTEDATTFYIGSLKQQMAEAEFNNKENAAGRMDPTTEQCEVEAQQEVDQAEETFMEQAAEWEPLSWKLGNPQPAGSQDGPVLFQAGGSRDKQPSESV